MSKAREKSKKSGRQFLREAFAAEQEVLRVKLKLSTKSITHGGVMGDVNEQHFIEILSKYLPRRYAVDSAIVIDSKGRTSDQIDVVIFDEHYTPTLLDQHSHRFVPAEAVYAVFEVKPTINSPYFRYASEKAESVRKLHRTSIPIPHAGGEYKAKVLHTIVSGIIASRVDWKDKFKSKAFKGNLSEWQGNRSLDCGLAVSGACFDTFDDGKLQIGPDKNSLTFFIFRLLQKLQSLGTVPAVDWNKYASALSSHKIVSK